MELADLQRRLRVDVDAVFDALRPPSATDRIDSIMIEVDAGVGGEEASLFANELEAMYARYGAYRQWNVVAVPRSTYSRAATAPGHALNVRGDRVYQWMKYEGGVHRVQRVPRTERNGRTHTSTASVVIIAEPGDVDVQVTSWDCW